MWGHTLHSLNFICFLLNIISVQGAIDQYEWSVMASWWARRNIVRFCDFSKHCMWCSEHSSEPMFWYHHIFLANKAYISYGILYYIHPYAHPLVRSGSVWRAAFLNYVVQQLMQYTFYSSWRFLRRLSNCSAFGAVRVSGKWYLLLISFKKSGGQFSGFSFPKMGNYSKIIVVIFIRCLPINPISCIVLFNTETLWYTHFSVATSDESIYYVWAESRCIRDCYLKLLC